MLTPRRFAAPLSASVALVLALSACTTSSVKSQESSPTMSESSAAAATSESSPVNTAAASESADDKLPVGLTDDNKAGKPRPRSSMKDTLKGATINEDGSWTYDKPDGTVMTTNADGTWHWKDEKNGQEATLHADGSWDYSTHNEYVKKTIHMNADGTWRQKNEKTGDSTETRADGSWENHEGGGKYVTTGTTEGTATKKNTATGEEREIPKEGFPVVPPAPHTQVTENVVGPNSVVPLKPRAGLKPGLKVTYAVPGSEEDKQASAEADGTALTDDNKAGKPRPRSTDKYPESNATINEDGSWTHTTVGGVEVKVNADGTWEWKSTKDGSSAALHADGSWDFDDVKYQQKIHVNADGSWTWEDQRNQSVTVTHADGSWRYEDDRSLDTGLADGTAHHVDKQHSNFNREIKKEHFPAKVPGFPTSYVSKNGVGPNSVVPLKPRTPLKVGQKAVS